MVTKTSDAFKAALSETNRLVSATTLKQLIKSVGLRVGGEFHGAVQQELGKLLLKAIKRCEANGRATLRPEDL